MEKVMIYGAGNMGKAVCKLLEGRCEVVCFLDKNMQLENTYIDDRFPILHPDNKAIDRNCKVVVAMVACTFESVKIDLMNCGGGGYQSVVPAEELISHFYAEESIFFTNLWHLKCNIDIDAYMELFTDSISKANWKMAYEWFAERKESGYFVEDRKKYFPDFLKAELDACMTMLDTAILGGDYVDEFLKGDARRIVYALMLNPPSTNYQKLTRKYLGKRVHLLDEEAGEFNEEVSATRMGMMEPFTSIETVDYRTKKVDDMGLPKFDYMRCYSMSRVEPILKGAYDSIVKYRPIIAVNIGHYESDFIHVPVLLEKMCENYKFYLRLHSYQGNDCIMYALPRNMTFGKDNGREK